MNKIAVAAWTLLLLTPALADEPLTQEQVQQRAVQAYQNVANTTLKELAAMQNELELLTRLMAGLLDEQQKLRADMEARR